jgi:NAD(P)-dependent dehydrogenase (short-subunit alcohol dehydrogenase family)
LRPGQAATIEVDACPGKEVRGHVDSLQRGEAVEKFGANVPMKRAGQPAELATAYAMLADPLSSYTSGATIAVTGGHPFL